MTERIDSSQLDDALAFVAPPARYHVVDAIACYLHNDGYALEGNTEANDGDWFARQIWQRMNPGESYLGRARE
jgi:hypothetical protein